MNLPRFVRLTHCDTREVDLGLIETLSRDAAKNDIDASWWQGLDDCLCDPADEPDRHWNWCAIVSTYQNKPSFQAKCIRTPDSVIQAAILFRVDALSALKAGERALFVDRLATAPRNRAGLVRNPLYSGAGTGLLAYAVAISYSLGFKGRVNLIPVAHEGFYTSKGFQATTVTEGQDILFEISEGAALQLLTSRGLFDDP